MSVQRSTSPTRIIIEYLIIRCIVISNYQGFDDQTIAGISNTPLLGQQLHVEEPESGRALFCPQAKKWIQKADKLHHAVNGIMMPKAIGKLL
ncbi:hypothetical protein M0802_015550 [Mischocyttarus mexicanus]|nr:hypothetical protein M0802_015550 [Mischocyttarus mexicanus]